jgi:hypothetical protein
MAAYDNLPAYKAACDLLLDVYRMRDNLTRNYKHTLAEDLKNELKELIVFIYKANANEEEKEQNLRQARELMVVIKLDMRMLHELGQLTLKRFIALGDKTENLSKQITAWHRSTVSRQKAIVQN